jgi:hypothetical protein
MISINALGKVEVLECVYKVEVDCRVTFYTVSLSNLIIVEGLRKPTKNTQAVLLVSYLVLTQCGS